MTCWARIDLYPDEVAYLNQLPSAHYQLPEQPPGSVRCSLQPGHPGPHASMMQSSGADPDVEYWMRWTLRASEITVLPNCEAHDRADPQEVCLLFAEHPGPHSFDRPD